MSFYEQNGKYGVFLKYGNLDLYFERHDARNHFNQLKEIINSWDRKNHIACAECNACPNDTCPFCKQPMRT